jgi:hypothetical protein
MNEQEIKDQIYFLSFEYRDWGYTDRLDNAINK